jgi:hypothetical protein
MKKIITAGLVVLALIGGYVARPTVEKVVQYSSLSTKAETFKREHQRAFLRCDARCEAYNATWKPQYEAMKSEANAVFK